MSKTEAARRPRGGKLKIGDPWNAIRIIARSQTSSLKAVCELVENAIDAGGRHLVLTRFKKAGHLFLEARDNGRGVKRDEDGLPDFRYVATHICDSMKRTLDAAEKAGVHGEYGIGLLGFWSLGKELRMVSTATDGQAWELIMKEGSDSFSIRRHVGEWLGGGCLVRIGPLHPSVVRLLSAEKLAFYLGGELRERLRREQVKLLIHDRAGRKQIEVKPRSYTGLRLDLPAEITTVHGNLRIDLYYGQEGGEGLFFIKDGTRVGESLTSVLSLDLAPWNHPSLIGQVDAPFIHLSPGNRSAAVPDERLEAVLSALETLAPSLTKALADCERLDEERANQALLKQLQKTFADALRSLPDKEYLFFDVADTKGRPDGVSGGLLNEMEEDPPAIAQDLAEAPVFPGLPSDLVELRLRPRVALLHPGDTKRFSVKVFDARGQEVGEHAEISWKISGDEAVFLDGISGPAVTLTAKAIGVSTLQATATLGARAMGAEAKIRVLEKREVEDLLGGAGKGLPHYELVADPGGNWRSRYRVEKNTIEVNSAHGDYITAKATLAALRRYLVKIYAKEIVLLNFPGEKPAVIAERMIELLTRLENQAGSKAEEK